MVSAPSPSLNLHFFLGTKSLKDSTQYQWLWGVLWHVWEEVSLDLNASLEDHGGANCLKDCSGKTVGLRLSWVIWFCISISLVQHGGFCLPLSSLWGAVERTQHCADSGSFCFFPFHSFLVWACSYQTTQYERQGEEGRVWRSALFPFTAWLYSLIIWRCFLEELAPCRKKMGN